MGKRRRNWEKMITDERWEDFFLKWRQSGGKRPAYMHGFTKKEKKEIDSRLRPQDGNVNKMKKKVIKERN